MGGPQIGSEAPKRASREVISWFSSCLTAAKSARGARDRDNGPVSTTPKAETLAELTAPVDLCDALGGLNPDAVGWARGPMVRANLRGRGRSKRWEYWAVMSPASVLAVTVSDLDYATLHAVYYRDADGGEIAEHALTPFGRVALPESCGAGPVHVRTRDLSIHLKPTTSGMHLRVKGLRVEADVRVHRPGGHEALAVVVPWSRRLFQHTVKENTLPATGQITVDGATTDLTGAWATLDHGRGRWPYAITWNWGSGSGLVDGRVVGVQVGGRWTDGTGSTENALCVDGTVHYIGEDLAWGYDRDEWLAPWTVRSPESDRVDLVFHPEHVRADQTSLLLVANTTHQAFGTWTGTMTDDSGRQVRVDGVRGWAEEVVNRW
ncbi:MAG: DUF2804 domain-containing protein [Actinobacteria bacterium]|nr:DUF2804 domain-containing protein [Actinomycetota bacterium]